MRTATETLEAARDARSAGEVDRCLLLSAAAQSLATDEHDTDTAFLAACVPGRLYLSRAEPEEAVPFYREALEVALSGGRTIRLPQIYHDLYLACRDSGSFDAPAKRYCATAFELYHDLNPRQPRLAGLMADQAEARFMARPCPETAADALQQWRALPTSLQGAAERFFAGCNAMVSAAWLGLHTRYRGGVETMSAAMEELSGHEGVALGLSHAATGSLKIGDYPRALRLAESAVRIARERGEGIVEARAAEVRDAALAERPAALHI